MTKKDSSARITKPSKKFPVSLDPDLYDFLVQEAQARYGGNRSAVIAEAIRDAKERNDSPFAPENALMSDVKQVVRKLGLTYERDDRGVDWVIPGLGVGLELKARFNGNTESAMVAAMGYSAGRGRCTEIVNDGGESLAPEAAAKLRDVATRFKLCKASYVPIGELASALGRIAKERSKEAGTHRGGLEQSA
jgi:hypothetical protein